MRYLFLIFVLVWPLAVVADFDAGTLAYQRGDYAAALREWLPLAEQGDAFAQNALGAMYANGEGVPENDVQAYAWYNLAAAQGDAMAMENKGIAEARMTPSHISEAQSLSSDLISRIGSGN